MTTKKAGELPTLTDAQDRVLQAFGRLLKQTSAPSLQEWADAAGIAYSPLHTHRQNLIDKRLLKRTPGRNRSTRLTDLGVEYLKRKRRTL